MGELDGPILPRVKTTRFVEAAKAIAGMDADNLPHIQPMAGDLVLAYAVDAGDAFVSVTPALMRQRRLDWIALHAEAFENLSKVLPQLAVKRLGPAFQVELPNDLSACAWFLSDFWDDMRRQLGARPMAAFAHRNFVAFAAEGDAEARDFLRHAMGSLPADDPHGLSQALYLWDGRWRPEGEAGKAQAAAAPIGREVALAEGFPAVDGEGRLKLPASLRCTACDGAVEIGGKAVKQALGDAAAGSPVLRSFQPSELKLLATVAARFVRSGPGRFAVDARCPGCGAAWLIGGEDHRGSLFGASFRPVKLWSLGKEAG
ncbi:MAG TPA: hypothetical protein VFK48_10510 [Usitatibacter sp.]|nr:hypothetical protein [Usitatibacter sp.]